MDLCKVESVSAAASLGPQMCLGGGGDTDLRGGSDTVTCFIRACSEHQNAFRGRGSVYIFIRALDRIIYTCRRHETLPASEREDDLSKFSTYSTEIRKCIRRFGYACTA